MSKLSSISEEFEKVFDSHSSGCIHECQCGRVFFDVYNDDWDWEEGELEKLEDLAKKEPDKYISVAHSVGYMRIDGKNFVYDCPCNQIVKYEQFLLNHEEDIAQFLNLRAAKLRELANKIEVKGDKNNQ